jgi:hypothetical protein
MKVIDLIMHQGADVRLVSNGKMLMFVNNEWYIYNRKEFPKLKSLLKKTKDEDEAVEVLMGGKLNEIR